MALSLYNSIIIAFVRVVPPLTLSSPSLNIRGG